MAGPDLEAYVLAHTTPVAPHLAEIEAYTYAELDTPGMLSGAVVGRLLETLVAVARPALVVEIGTFSGYGTLSMAAALPPGGRVITLELSDERADIARRHFETAGLADRIELRRGPALASLQSIDEPIDFVFLDAEKTGYLDYYETAIPKLAPGGLLVADNTLRRGRVLAPEDEGTRAMAAFNDHLVADARVVAVMLTVRDGLTVVRKLG